MKPSSSSFANLEPAAKLRYDLYRAVSPAATDALHVVACFVLVACFAKALRVFPSVFTTERLGLDVIDVNGWGYKAVFRAVTAKWLGINPSIA